MAMVPSAGADVGTDDVMEPTVFQDPRSLNQKETQSRRNELGALSNVTPESIRRYIKSVITRLSERITLDTLRPLPMFLGIQGTAGQSVGLAAGAFTRPPLTADNDKSVWDHLQTRLTLNGALFLTNYAVVAGGVAIVIAMLHPGMLLVVSVIWALWWCHDYLIHQTVTVGSYNIGTLLSIHQRSTILSILTVVAIVWKCLFPILSFLLVSGILIGLHAASRDPQHIEQQYDKKSMCNGKESFAMDGNQV